MKFKKKMIGLAMCVAIGGMSCFSVSAKAEHRHTLDDVGRQEVGRYYKNENCEHCGTCVSCSDDVTYGYFVDNYVCSECGEFFSSDVYVDEIERTCNCSNSACCY